MAGYQYVQLDQIPYQGTVNAYGIAVDIDPTNDRVKIRDEVGEALLIGRIQNLIKDLKIGDIVRLHRVKAIPTNYLEYALGRFGNSIVVWDPNSESLEVPKYKDSVTFTLNHEDKRRVEQLKKIKFRQPKSNDELQACLKTSITRKIISQVACIPFELDENCSMEIREALASVNANQTKTLTCLENIDETYLQGKQYFNFIAVVAEIYRTSQTTFVRVFDGTISPVSSKLLKYHGGDHIAVKRLPGGVTERTNEYLLDVACYGEHAKSANELTLGDFAVFTNAHVYAKQHGDKMICLHDGEIFRRTVATVNVECSLVTTLTNRCRSVVDELFTMSQSQSTQYTCNSSEVSTQNSDNAQVLRTTFTPECRKRKADEGKNHDDSNDKKNRILSSGTPSVAPRKSVQFRIPIENEAPPIPMHQLPKKTTSECSTSNASDHHELPNLTSLNNSQPEASSDELRLHVTTTPCSILKKRSIKSIERTMVHEVSSSQDREENLDSHNATSPNAQTLDTDIFNNDAQNHISLVDSSSESSLKKKYTPTFYEACEVYSFYKNVKEMMKEVFSERINPPHFSLNEEIQIIQGLEGDSSCMMENFMEVNSVLFLDRMFLSNCVIFTGNCNVCFNEVRLKRRQNAFCPNCLKKNKKSTRFHIGLRMLFPINSSFLVGISREQVMKYEQSPCLDTDKVTHAFHIDNEEEYEQYASDLILLASSIAHRYKIRAGYGRVVPKRNPHGPTVVFIEECSLEEKFP